MELVVEGVHYPAHHFEGQYDIALGLLSDGVQVFKKVCNGSASAWPFLAVNYSIQPEVHTHLKFLIPLGLAPGPHSPKDHNSFLHPFFCDMAKLAHGILTWNVLEQNKFLLRAFLITKIADMQALKANQYLKGPNAFSPCRACCIQGCRDPDHSGSNYYYPIHAPPGAIRLDHSPALDWDPENLPLHTDENYKKSLKYIQSGITKKECECCAKTESILVHLPGFSRVGSVPHEWMHLVMENIEPTLVDLWTGRFKGLNEGTETYVIPSHLWDLIGTETAAAMATIPTVF